MRIYNFTPTRFLNLAFLTVSLLLVGCKAYSYDIRSHTTHIINYSWDGNPLSPNDIATVTTRWLSNGDLQLQIKAPFNHDPKPNCPKQSCWGLSGHEVVKLLLVGQFPNAHYTIIEISPWGNYLVLQLQGARNVVRRHLPLKVVSHRNSYTWQADAVLSSRYIPEGELKVNAYRISGVGAARQYHVMTPMRSEVPDCHLISQFKKVLHRLP